MKTNGKYIIQVTGPLLKYRLDILAKVCPEARHFLLVLTNKFSYNLLFVGIRNISGFGFANFKFSLSIQYNSTS